MIHTLNGKKPKISKNVFAAPGSQIIGNVTIKSGASIWYNAVVRGDVDWIEIGENTNIQENCSLHIDPGHPMTLGNNITVGHGAILHGCTIEDNCLIGMGATILNDAVIGSNSIIGAGALITEGKKIPPRSLVIGVPGKVIRELDEKAITEIKKSATHYAELAREYMN